MNDDIFRAMRLRSAGRQTAAADERRHVLRARELGRLVEHLLDRAPVARNALVEPGRRREGRQAGDERHLASGEIADDGEQAARR